MVTAAFIGPGTITTASIAGATYGYALLWALLFSVFATITLQEMTARLGLVSRQGLAEALRETFAGTWLGNLAIILVVAAVGLGNAAYEAGNITGAALGLQSISGHSVSLWSLTVGALAAGLLASGRYAIIEKLLIVLVLLMSMVFLVTLLMVGPGLSAIMGGLLVPRIPEGSLLTVIALIGTTVVPYNLFLHSSAVQEKWSSSTDVNVSLQQARLDNGVSIGLGGLITLAVMSTSAAAFFGGDSEFSAANMAQQLEPLLGPAASYFFAAGLFSAGLSSAVHRPAGGRLCRMWRDGLVQGIGWKSLSTGVGYGADQRYILRGNRNQAPRCYSIRAGCQRLSTSHLRDLPTGHHESTQRAWRLYQSSLD